MQFDRARTVGSVQVCICLILFLTTQLLARPAWGRTREQQLLVYHPSEGQSVVSVPFVEIRGVTGAGQRPPKQAVLLLDTSRSSLLPSGFDVDSDGEVGTFRRKGGSIRPRFSSDPGDSMAQAALLGATEVIRCLARAETRLGLVTFGTLARVEAELGEAGYALDMLDHVRRHTNQPRTSISRAIRTGLKLLNRERLAAEGERSLIIFSDGVATEPGPPIHARRASLRLADRAAEEGVSIHAFSFGGSHGTDLLREVATRTGGTVIAVRRREDFENMFRWQTSELTDVAFTNGANNAAGVAVRVFSDGSFDGFVPLAPGRNFIDVTGTFASGDKLHAHMEVQFDPRRATKKSELRTLVQLRKRIALRSLETELAVAAARPLSRQRSVEILTLPGWGPTAE